MQCWGRRVELRRFRSTGNLRVQGRMEGENRKAYKYITNQPASVHHYGKLSKSESPRTHSSPTSILRKFPHSLRHDQKHQTKIKRDPSPVSRVISGMSALCGAREGPRVLTSDDSEERPSSKESRGTEEDDLRKKRKFSEASSECSSDGDVWKPQHGVEGGNCKPFESTTDHPIQKNKTFGSIKKLSVINNLRENGSVNRVSMRSDFSVHKSTPNLLRSDTFGSALLRTDYGGDRRMNGKTAFRQKCGRTDRDGSLRSSDSLPQLDQTYRIIHSILPKINRTISESHESLSSLKNKKPYVKSESHIERFHNRINRAQSMAFDGKSDGSQSEEESEGLSLIDSRKTIVVQPTKDRKNRWSYKKTVDRMPSLRQLIGRRDRGSGSGSGDGEAEAEDASPGPAAPFMTAFPPPSSESCTSLSVPQIRYFDEEDEEFSVKKCETVYALSNLIRADSRLQVEPMQAINRLRVPPNGFSGSTSRMCSRCSSLLSMASSSRYSINTTGSGFVTCSPTSEKPPEPGILCKLCLMEVPASFSMEISHCGCVFCKDCMRLYVEFEIQEGAYDISCPDAQCAKQGVVTLGEVEALVMPRMMERYLRFRLNHEVDMDRNRTWCPRAGCETVCDICPREKCAPTSVRCPTCASDFCSNCKNTWHEGFTCEENSRRLAKEGRSDFMEPGIPFDSDSIKCCPMCNVPIEKDEGCAQMMCKRCKHVFCWYCLASLDDDFLLRHYDKGPCKNKLGHSRASVIWHRTQVIGIFAGLGLLLLVASPLLLLAAPCIVCCKCRVCSGTKLDADDDLPEEAGT